MPSNFSRKRPMASENGQNEAKNGSHKCFQNKERNYLFIR